jgi:hypothetical protein
MGVGLFFPWSTIMIWHCNHSYCLSWYEMPKWSGKGWVNVWGLSSIPMAPASMPCAIMRCGCELHGA